MHQRNRSYAILLFILLAAFALRVYRLESRAVWYDEAFSVFLSEQDFGDLVRGTAADIQPPLYYVLLHLWQALGPQVLVLRFLSVVFSVLSVALVYRLGRRLLFPRASILAMFFSAIMPFQIAYAQELRMYSLLGFSLLVYFFAFMLILRGEKIRFGTLLLGLSGAVALYTQSLAILTIIVPDVFLLFRRSRLTARQLLIGQGLALVLFAPWLVVMLGQFASVQRAYWTGRPGLVEILQLLLALTTSQPLPAWFLPFALFVSLAVVALLALELVRLFQRDASSELVLSAGFVLLPMLVMFALSYVLRSIFVERAVIHSLLAFTLLLGWWVGKIKRATVRRAVIGFSLLVVAVPLSFQYGYDQFPRSPFQAADSYLSAHAQAGDVILHDNKLSFFPMHLYDRALPQSWLADPPEAGSNTLAPESMRVMHIFPTGAEEATRDASRVWFIIFQRAIDEADAPVHPNLAWLDRNFHRVGLERFNDLDIFIFEK